MCIRDRLPFDTLQGKETLPHGKCEGRPYLQDGHPVLHHLPQGISGLICLLYTSSALSYIILTTQVIPGALIVVPMYVILGNMNLLDNMFRCV